MDRVPDLPPRTVHPMPGALLAGGILGFLGGLALAGIVVGVGVPLGPPLGGWWNLVFAGVWLGGGALLAALSWRANTLRFEPDHLVITRATGLRRRIPWAHVHGIGTGSSFDEDGDVVSRWLTVQVLRHPERPLPPSPSTLGEFRVWRREYIRSFSLNVPLAVKPVDSASRRGRTRYRTRRIVTGELESRGFRIPE